MSGSETLEMVGGVLILIGCLGVLAFFVLLWLPWAWLYIVENAKWLQAHGDLSRKTQWIVRFDRWLQRVGVSRDR